jgi:hypothetical protein
MELAESGTFVALMFPHSARLHADYSTDDFSVRWD